MVVSDFETGLDSYTFENRFFLGFVTPCGDNFVSLLVRNHQLEGDSCTLLFLRFWSVFSDLFFFRCLS